MGLLEEHAATCGFTLASYPKISCNILVWENTIFGLMLNSTTVVFSRFSKFRSNEP